MTFSEIQKIFEKKFGSNRPADMARELGVTPQVVSNWKSRDQVPYKYVKRLREKIDDGQDKSKLNIPFVPLDSIIGNIKDRDSEDILNKTTIFTLIKIIVQSIRKNKLIFFIVPTFFAVFIYIKAFYFEKPYFISTGKIIPQAEEGISSKLSGLMSTFGMPVSSGGIDINSSELFPDIIKSRDFNINLLYRKFYLKSIGSEVSLIKFFTGKVPSASKDSLRLNSIGLGRLRRMVSIRTSKITPVITIQVIAPEPELASELATAIIEELDKFQRRFKTDKIKEKRIFIDSRMVAVKNDLIKVEENLKMFRQQNKNRTSPALMLQEERLGREVEVQTEIYITLMQESELAQIEEVENARMITILDSPITPLHSSNPIFSRRLTLSIMLGFFFSSIIIIMKQWWNQNWDSNIKPLLEKQ